MAELAARTANGLGSGSLSSVISKIDERQKIDRRQTTETTTVATSLSSLALAAEEEQHESSFADFWTPEFLMRRAEMYESLVSNYSTKFGKLVSQKDRQLMENAPATLTYGEIEFGSFATAFEKIKRIYGIPGVGTTPPGGILQEPGGKFYDIGSGTGKPALAAAFLHPFEFVGGVELLPSLHEVSFQLADAFRVKGHASLVADGQTRTTAVSFILGDATDLAVLDWSDGDVLFANSTCFNDTLMTNVAKAAESLKKVGSLIFLLIHKMLSR